MALRYILIGFMQPTFWMFGLNFASPSGSRRAFRRQPSYLPRTMADLFAVQEPPEPPVSPPDATAPLADRQRPPPPADVVVPAHLTVPERPPGRQHALGHPSPTSTRGPPAPPQHE